MSIANKFGGTGGLSRFFTNYGMLAILLLLCLLFSVLTLRDQYPVGAEAARAITSASDDITGKAVLIVGRGNDEDSLFARVLSDFALGQNPSRVRIVSGDPAEIKAGLSALADSGSRFRYHLHNSITLAGRRDD